MNNALHLKFDRCVHFFVGQRGATRRRQAKNEPTRVSFSKENVRQWQKLSNSNDGIIDPREGTH